MYRDIVVAGILVFAGGLGLLGLSPVSSTVPAVAADTLAIAIQISPSVLVVGSSGDWVTVHTDLPLSLADPATLALDAVPAELVYADACGNLVAKFDRRTIESMVGMGTATLTLSGLTDDAVPFSGDDTITVKPLAGK